MSKKTVFVGLSGGVDSAVSAALLKERGYEVVGVFIKTWHPDFLVCNEEEERLDAMRVAAYLDIPFLTLDLEDVYKKEVADYMIAEYKKGRTPNPDVMCNKYVKFGAFLDKAISMGADYVATGHYVNVNKILKNSPAFALGVKKTGDPRLLNFSKFSLVKAEDTSKDQTYFLWTLKQEQLKRILFPVGHLKKTEVRRLATKFGLPVKDKKDSQGICFLGMVDLKDFLKHYIKEKKGDVILIPSEVEGGGKKVIGHHIGAVFYTLGERHGFTITEKGTKDGRYYVVDKDIKKNILIVSQSKYKNVLEKSMDIFLLKNSSCSRQSRSQVSFQEHFCVSLENTNWINDIPEENRNYTVQIRYHGEFILCKIVAESRDLGKVMFDKPVLVASGQSCVFYDGDICIGGGVVV